ncbi:hypothetical protein AMTR_s00009p00262400 [Amborella trichopoda]|uniref:Polygalacturonase-like n=1 Tax=Amborella trichopoda TaxID=13333 RepID=W1NJ36_AMBTC|nr:hypothetical protein AMTR_s00009p00262400 [Amborella trichopoda]
MAMKLLIILSLLFTLGSADIIIDVTDFGTKADGKSDDSHAFVKAWNSACNSEDSTTFQVPAGKYLLYPTTFGGPCKSSKITINLKGELIASPDINKVKDGAWIRFEKVEGLEINGGVLDGKGALYWVCKEDDGDCPIGAKSLLFNKCKNVTINNLTSMNSKKFHIVFNDSKGIKVHGIKIRAPGDSPNTDGIHVEGSSDVLITDPSIQTGDDCISIGPGTHNLHVERVTCGPGHGISIGSLGHHLDEAGVQDVTVKNVVFDGTTNGLRIKTFARKSNGFVKNIVYDGVVMNNVENPIIIDQKYCPHEHCPHQV